VVTCTLKDSTPTTTITFETFEEIERKIIAEGFFKTALPENGGTLIVFLGQYSRMFTIQFVLKDDDTWPSSGDSAADKRADLENLILTGGDNLWQFRLTFDSEDSTSGSPQTEYYDGYVKNLNIRSVSGEHVKTIEGDFEFWEGEPT
jgi:hypothetical protein